MEIVCRAGWKVRVFPVSWCWQPTDCPKCPTPNGSGFRQWPRFLVGLTVVELIQRIFGSVAKNFAGQP